MIDKRTTILSIITIVLVILIAFLVYVNYIYSKDCQSYECFKTHIAACSRAAYQSDKDEATWKYYITGVDGSACTIKVALLQAKKGELGLNELNGQEMTCSVEKGIIAYPENDLSKCHGLLKEGLQNIMINKLYGYIVDNLGQIDSNLKSTI